MVVRTKLPALVFIKLDFNHWLVTIVIVTMIFAWQLFLAQMPVIPVSYIVLINGGAKVKYGTHKKSAGTVCIVTWEGSVRTLDGHKWLCDVHILGHLREGGCHQGEGTWCYSAASVCLVHKVLQT